MKLTYDFGDVVETDRCPTPRILTIFGELRKPSEGGNAYVGGDSKTFGRPLPNHPLRVIGTDEKLATKCRARYLKKAPNGLKDL